MTKVLSRLTFVLIGLFLFMVVLAILVRKPLAEVAAERALGSAGFASATVEVTRFDTNGASMAVQTAEAPEALRLTLQADWTLGDLVFGRNVARVILRDVSATVRVGADGSVTVVGAPEQRSSRVKERNGLLPSGIEAIVVEDAKITVLSPKGRADAKVSGDVDAVAGGTFAIAAATPAIGTHDVMLSDLRLDGELGLPVNAPAQITGILTADVLTRVGRIDGLAVNLHGNLSDWASMLLSGDRRETDYPEATAVLSLSSSGSANTGMGLSARSNAAELVSVNGDMSLLMRDGSVTVAPGAAPLTLSRSDGYSFIIDGSEELPLMTWSGDTVTVLTDVNVETPYGNGNAKVAISRAGDNDAAFEVSLRSASATRANFSLRDFGSNIRGTFDGWQLVGDTRFEAGGVEAHGIEASTVHTADRLAFELSLPYKDEPFAISFQTGALAAANITSSSGLTLMNVRISPARIDRPLLAIEGGEPVASMVVEAKEVRLRTGEESYAGTDLSVRMETRSEQDVIAEGALARMMGGGLIVRSVQGSGIVSVKNGAIFANVRNFSLEAIGEGEAPLFGAVRLAGRASYASGIGRVNAVIETPSGASLGQIEGRQFFSDGHGRADIAIGPLIFRPDGLQPDDIAPVLQGIIGTTTGDVSANATIGWSASGLTSRARLTTDGLSFRGPGVVVAETRGLVGSLSFSSLNPLVTDGAQRVDVELIDLNALRLENGTVAFSLPGNNTLEIAEASFPWFGGRLYTEAALGDLSGGLSASLFVENVDLGAVLDHLSVKGLSGKGRIEGVLPLVADNFVVSIEDGRLTSIGGGVVRYTGFEGAASSVGDNAQIAFDALRELRFTSLSAGVNGPLNGTLTFDLRFEGRSMLDLTGGRSEQRVDAPVIYRLSIEAPVLSLLEQARLAVDALPSISESLRSGQAGDAETPRHDP